MRLLTMAERLFNSGPGEQQQHQPQIQEKEDDEADQEEEDEEDTKGNDPDSQEYQEVLAFVKTLLVDIGQIFRIGLIDSEMRGILKDLLIMGQLRKVQEAVTSLKHAAIRAHGAGADGSQ